MLFNIIEGKVRYTILREKLQFVNSVKRLVFDLTKIPLLKQALLYADCMANIEIFPPPPL